MRGSEKESLTPPSQDARLGEGLACQAGDIRACVYLSILGTPLYLDATARTDARVRGPAQTSSFVRGRPDSYTFT